MSLAAVQPAPMRLEQLLAGVGETPAGALEVTGLATDSRQVAPGDLFLACAGGARHGVEYIDDAVARGAVAVLWEGEQPPAATVPSIRVTDLHRRVGEIASRFHGNPSANMLVVGVTGTDGKTSGTHLLTQALMHLGRTSGYLGTLGYGWLDALAVPTHTTPDAVSLQGWLARLAAAGTEAVALEVSSHALDQYRVNGTDIDIAVLTNIGRDHLDYHGSMEAYALAKRRLFEFAGLDHVILNVDDPTGAAWFADMAERSTSVAYGLMPHTPPLAGLHVFATDLLTRPGGLVIEVDSSWGRMRVESGLLGRFNAYNLLAVLAVLLVDGVAPDRAVAALAALQTVPGRMEVVDAQGRGPLVVVDYAHTAGALEHALRALGEHVDGRLHCVFGCGGDRDAGKRPLMGAVAARLADWVWVTDDNPRHEDGDAIVRAIVSGMPGGAAVTVQRDRAAAIAEAIAAAGANDAVLIAGKGHETDQQIGDERRPFDDRLAARRVLEAA
ncbi:UDP-N-acetylmuramoyl-L-alanyl-D-glutamate--2,6-diaminopimelate ligase [Spectribacter hydrogenoxidans]|uniref:UDP-N-acetylmuramoyl-L-alanyl-D-glutamate--2,6-diaminopimelate ligase n=1 Tax=Spectribacter hydrogenoxidans TaxID=3075608 RepID=A0ABU3BX34_9GAMM|nr:UDP-N-acetylmuramoyl-L-alanyl-D-glutamate--2,6-diaminopimelate ligase [Salinisphaera sp. W335]MDT0633870.1 UDP-N-acetylmuramoyl-L-alanyl-D-glutamate--2,6-diaminopimelate ligase [Salinisphaera sp. W335]